jgi:hypothetical protein
MKFYGFIYSFTYTDAAVTPATTCEHSIVGQTELEMKTCTECEGPCIRRSDNSVACLEECSDGQFKTQSTKSGELFIDECSACSGS